MSRFDFRGDVEDVAQAQLNFISNVLDKKGFNGPDVSIETVGEAGDNYVASVKRIVINENGVTFKMIAKLAPENTMMRDMGHLGVFFHNEHVIYTEVLPKFRELQRSAGIPKEEWFRFAECYGSKNEVPHETILLEDLKEDKYIMLDRFKPLNNDCVKIVLKNMAIYHSLSYVLKHQEPETFTALKSKLEDMFTGDMGKRDDIKFFFQQMEDGALAIVQDKKYREFIKGSVSEIFQHATETITVDTDSKYSVIQQGDGWTNNILFQMKGETPLNCVLIDYQLAREGNPAYDIMYMLFNSTNHEQRQKHYYEFMDYYHSEMDKSLRNYGFNAASLYPREQLDADLKRYGKFMLATSIMLSTFIIRKSEDASKFKESMQNSTADNVEDSIKAALIQDEDTSVLFKNRVEGFIDSFLEFGLLQPL